ncbi:MAG: DUF6398 domain-containing protein [Egibacteraceae bacterium]
MPKKKHTRKQPRPHHPPGGRAGRPAPAASGEPELILDVRGMLAVSHPLDLLAYASSMVAALDPGLQDPFTRAQDDQRAGGPDLRHLVETFTEARAVETTALLIVLAELLDDEVLVRRIRRELALRDDALPPWLSDLGPLTPARAMEMGHVLGDGDSIALEMRTGTDAPLTMMVYIDHNLGTVVKDAFVVPAPVGALIDQFLDAAGGDPDTHVRGLDLADARVRIGEAVEVGAVTYPPFETETWPAARPLVEWALGHLPEGGTGYRRPEWSEEDRAALTARFFDSSEGRGHDAEDRHLFASLLWFGCDYGPGDPLRWSPTAVEILLSDWLPRKVMADAGFLARAPDLLRSFIRFSHAERGIREALTAETLAAVDRWEPEYQQAVRSPRPQGPAALLAAMGVLDDGNSVDDETVDADRAMRAILREAVGGAEALDALDAEPLPDEELDLSAVPPDVHERVTEIAEHIDACCGALLDGEYRTACRRLLADVAAADPQVFRRRARSDTAAAAVVWLVARANERLRAQAGGLTATALGRWFGVADPAQRASTMRRALGLPQARAHSAALGSPRYLVSGRRLRIIEWRERFESPGS